MSDQVGEYSVNNMPLFENTLTLNVVKDEEYKDEGFVDDKVCVYETAIVKDNAELQDYVLPDKMEHSICTTWDKIKTEHSFPEVQHNMICDNLKIEGGINGGDIKIEFTNKLLYCEDCRIYYEEYCAQCGMLVHILNRTALVNDGDRSREGLPRDDMLEIQDYYGQFHVFALKIIPVGVRFGPFIGLNRTEHPWKIKDGKFIVNKDKSKYLNWMQYIDHAKNISEQNLLVFQCDDNLYYQSARQIQEGDELLVYFSEEYKDSLNGNVEADFIPTTECVFNDAFACTFCCLGFSSKLHLVKHKTICPKNVAGEFSIEELIQCPSCKIYLDRKEYILHHMAYCCQSNDRKCILPTPDNRTAQVSGRKTRSCQLYECQQCKYRTKYKGDLKNHTNQHNEVKMYKCGVCCIRFKTKDVLGLHVQNAHISADRKENSGRSTEDYTNAYIKARHSCFQDGMKPFKCSSCDFRTKNLKELNFKCDTCNFKTNLKSNLTNHIKRRHLKEFKYKCGTCDYKANSKGHLKGHIETKHLKVFKYKCDRCEYKTNAKFNLKDHIEIRHLKEFKYECGSCDFKANSKYKLKNHAEARHSKEFKYKCDLCGYKTAFKQRLKIHIGSRHLKEFKYKCDKCDHKTNLKSNLKAHIETRHLKGYRYKCDACSYAAYWKFNLRIHVQAKHLKEFKYKCDICDYKTNRKSYLRTHTESIHLKEFKYKCDTCDYKTNLKHHFKVHIDTIHLKEFKYKCDTCDYTTNWKSQLKVHIEAKHLKEFKYKCDTCDYKTNRKDILKTHIEAIHLKEFKYKCDICDYKANFKSNLKRHVEVRHLKEFQFKCDACNYKTNLKLSLAKHIDARHLKALKYNCNFCDYKANWKCLIKRHIEAKHTKEFKHKCNMCGYGSNRKFYLQKHIERRHLQKDLNIKM